MREILFKAKRTDNGEWLEGCLLIDDITGQYFIHRYGDSVNESNKVGEEGCLRFLAFEIDSSTICQYTGLNDRTQWEELAKKEQQKFLSEWNYKDNRKNQKEDWRGKKIWENDIVKVRHEKYPETPNTEFDLFPTATVYTRNYAVEFINSGSNYGYRCRNRSIHFLITKNTIYNHDVEVIGNIFDNPELLGRD